jgi:hypothetical protein
MKKMWHLNIIKFYSATKKNEILSFAGEGMELENIILSEVSQVQKAKSCMFSHMWKRDLIKMQQCYEKVFMLRGAHT